VSLTTRATAFNTRCNLSVIVFGARRKRRCSSLHESVDECCSRHGVKRTSDATKLTYPEETCRTDVAYVLVETKIHEIVTPRRRTCSLAVTVSAPSRKPGPQPARSERLCFVPIQSSSVLSALSFRRFADIQWPMSVMQSSNRAAAEAVSQRLQCTYSYELIVQEYSRLLSQE